MSFENWNRFVEETKRELLQKRQEQRTGSGAAGSATGGASNGRKGKRGAQSIQKGMEQKKPRKGKGRAREILAAESSGAGSADRRTETAGGITL